MKKLYLYSVKRKGWQNKNDFGLWCNGNTTDSGPVFLGSNPSSPTDKNDYYFIGLWCNGNTTDSGPVFLGSNPSNPT